MKTTKECEEEWSQVGRDDHQNRSREGEGGEKEERERILDHRLCQYKRNRGQRWPRYIQQSRLLCDL